MNLKQTVLKQSAVHKQIFWWTNLQITEKKRKASNNKVIMSWTCQVNKSSHEKGVTEQTGKLHSGGIHYATINLLVESIKDKYLYISSREQVHKSHRKPRLARQRIRGSLLPEEANSVSVFYIRPAR